MPPFSSVMLPLAALGLCAALVTGAGAAVPEAVPNLAGFASDGCSMFPDGSYYSCCYVHDVAYWPGGTEEERKHADEELRACVRETTGSGFLAGLIYLGVRMGGGPGHDTTYRWGFGWPFPYREEYAPLTPEERKVLAEKTRALCDSLAPDPLTSGYRVDVEHEISAAQHERICAAQEGSR